jgi:class 3 adenylate cyclase
MKPLKFKTLQTRFIVLLLLPVTLILIAAGVFGFIYIRNAMLDQWNEAAILKLERAAHTIDMRLAKPFELMALFAETAGLPDSAGFQRQLLQRLEAIQGVVHVRLRWQAIENHSLDADRRRAMTAVPHKQPKQPRVTLPAYDSDSGHKTVVLVSAFFDSAGKKVARLEVHLKFDYLMADIIKVGWWQSDMACLIDRTGEYIVHTDTLMNSRHRIGENDDPLEREILNQLTRQTSGTVPGPGRPPKMVAGFASLQRVPWAIVLFAPGAKILKPIIHFKNAFILGSLALVMIILFLIRFHTGKIVRSIQLLSDNAKQVARGEYGEPVKAETEDEVGLLIGNYNRMVAGLKERDFIRNTFGRYVDPEVAKHLLAHPETARLGGRRKEVVIMMSDIRGFTPLSETLSPEETIYILNRYFEYMIRIINKYNGIIVDFVGDAILVFFQPLSEPLSATVNQGVRCAFEMQKEMTPFNEEIKAESFPELEMGIGVNAGPVVVGHIGSSARAKYGIVGSEVNITQRIQQQAKGKEVVVSESVYKSVSENVVLTDSVQIRLKGVQKPVTLHRIGRIK